MSIDKLSGKLVKHKHKYGDISDPTSSGYLGVYATLVDLQTAYPTANNKDYAFVAGKILAAVLRGMISSAIIVVLAYLFGAKFAITPLFIIILIINCIIFAEIGFSAAMTVQTFEDMARFNTYILLPMSFLCGTFFSTDKLPLLLHYFIEALPLTHTSTLLRAITHNQEISILSIGILCLYMGVLFIICNRILGKIKN